MIVALVTFGLSRSFWFATISLSAAAAVWEVSEPVLAAWVNRGLDPRTRATVNSVASQAHAIGEVAGGPTFGTIAVLTSTPTALVCAGLVQVPSVVVLARRRRTAVRIAGTVPADAAAIESTRLAAYADRIGAAVPHVQFVRMQARRRPGRRRPHRDVGGAEPDVAWLTADLFDGGPVRKFFRLRSTRSRSGSRSPAHGTDHPVFADVDQRRHLTTSHVTGIPIAEYIVRAVLDHYQRPGDGSRARSSHVDGRRTTSARSTARRGSSSVSAHRHRGRRSAPSAFGATSSACAVRRTDSEPVDECVRADQLDTCCRAPTSSCSPRPAVPTHGTSSTARGSRCSALRRCS